MFQESLERISMKLWIDATTNKAVSSWGIALGDSVSVRAALDRFLEFAYKLKFSGKSLRLENFNRRNKMNIQDSAEAITKD